LRCIKIVRSEYSELKIISEGVRSVLVGDSNGKRTFGRLRRRRETNIKMDLKEIGWNGVEWIHLAQDKEGWGSMRGGDSLK
jgi:hypothetical protein